MKFSIIACIYNAAPLVRQCLEALLARTTEDPSTWELILVDNHGPDASARVYIYSLPAICDARKIWIADPGRNLGCHEGWNFGFSRSEGDFVVKLDDDTIIQTDGWLTKMAEALERIPHLAYLSADIDAKQNNNYAYIKDGGITIEVPQNKGAVVGFSCVMFRRADILQWGPMKSNYRTAGGTTVGATEDHLYGGEEAYYSMMAQRENRQIAHFPAVFCHHLGNEERHPDYPAWKMVYGYYAWTKREMKDWIASGEHVAAYSKLILNEIRKPQPNDVLLRDWSTRLGQVAGDKMSRDVLLHLAEQTKNGVVQEACRKGIASIEERIQ